MNKILIFLLSLFFAYPTISYAQVNTDTVSTSVLTKIWNKFTHSSFTQKDLTGTWNFRSTACVFETENLLKKAGGSIVATQVENKFDEYFRKVGIKNGTCNFTFNPDSTYSAKLGVAKLSGKFTMDEKTKLVTMNYLLGIAKMRATAVKSGNKMKLLFDADAFLKTMKTLSMFTKDNSIEILAAMADLYDGMLIGFELNREK